MQLPAMKPRRAIAVIQLSLKDHSAMKAYFVLMLILTAGFAGVRYVCTSAVKDCFGAKAYLSLAVLLAGGFVLHNPLLFLGIAALVLLLTVGSATDALCRLLILTALCPDITPKLTVGTLYLTTLPLVFVLSVAALAAALFRPREASAGKITAEDVLVVLLMGCFGFAAARDQSLTEIQRQIVTIVLGLGIPYFVYRKLLVKLADMELAIAVLAGTAMILAVLAILEARMHWSLFDTIYANLSDNGTALRNTKMRGGIMRAPASFYDSTSFAVFQLTGVFAVICSRRFFRDSLFWTGSIGLVILGLLAAQSRGAVLGLLVGLFAIMAVRRRYALAAMVAGGGAALVALLVTLASASPRLAALIGGDGRTGTDQDYRQTLLRRGLQVGLEHPILGDDMTHVVAKMVDIKQGEGIVDFVNTYLTIFLNSGLVGLACFLALIVILLVRIWRIGSSPKDPGAIAVQMFLASALSAELFALIFTSFIYDRNAYWLIMLFALCRATVTHRRERDRGLAKPTQMRKSNQNLVHNWHAGQVPDPI